MQNDRLPNGPDAKPPIAILGVLFDNVTMADAIGTIERMVASRQPHYLVTANVDFVVQAQEDVELRRILFDANLVLCDGTPLVWASKLLGNPLLERVAGADLVDDRGQDKHDEQRGRAHHLLIGHDAGSLVIIA